MSPTLKTVGTQRILYVMAVDAEYGPHLKARITPFMTGIGPVEAAVQLTLALCHLEAEGSLPDIVVSLGFTRGATPLLDLPVEVPLPLRIPGLPAARLSTGANIVSGAAYDAIDADMVDMETFAALRACQAFDIPLIGLRGISDGKDDVTHIGDWTAYLHVIDEKLAAAVDMLEAAAAGGSLVRGG